MSYVVVVAGLLKSEPITDLRHARIRGGGYLLSRGGDLSVVEIRIGSRSGPVVWSVRRSKPRGLLLWTEGTDAVTD